MLFRSHVLEAQETVWLLKCGNVAHNAVAWSSVSCYGVKERQKLVEELAVIGHPMNHAKH